MKSSAIYRKAAEICSREHNGHEYDRRSACEALWDITHPYDRFDDVVKTFGFLMRPKGVSALRLWFGPRSIDDNQNCRVLALCFMAAIAESEGD